MLAINQFRKPNTAPLDGRRIWQYFRTGWQTFKQYPLGFIAYSLIMLLLIASQIFLEQKLGFVGSLLGYPSIPFLWGIILSVPSYFRNNLAFLPIFFWAFIITSL